MPWFEPKDGDPMMCGVQTGKKEYLKDSLTALLCLSMRVERMVNKEPDPEKAARGVGHRLYEKGALKELADSLRDLIVKVENDPLMWDWLESNGLNMGYRPASPGEARELENLSVWGWADLFGSRACSRAHEATGPAGGGLEDKRRRPTSSTRNWKPRPPRERAAEEISFGPEPEETICASDMTRSSAPKGAAR